MSRPRHGSTLVELIVTLVVMAIIAGAVTVALPREAQPPASDDVTSLRRKAIASRATTTASVRRNGRDVFVTAFPDGSVLADSGVTVDRLSGAMRAQH